MAKPISCRVVYTDANDGGYAGYTVGHGCHIAHGQWFSELNMERTLSCDTSVGGSCDKVEKVEGMLCSLQTTKMTSG